MMVDRADFPLLAMQPDLHYLDSAATSQKPRAVLDAMIAVGEKAPAPSRQRGQVGPPPCCGA